MQHMHQLTIPLHAHGLPAGRAWLPLVQEQGCGPRWPRDCLAERPSPVLRGKQDTAMSATGCFGGTIVHPAAGQMQQLFTSAGGLLCCCGDSSSTYSSKRRVYAEAAMCSLGVSPAVCTSPAEAAMESALQARTSPLARPHHMPATLAQPLLLLRLPLRAACLVVMCTGGRRISTPPM